MQQETRQVENSSFRTGPGKRLISFKELDSKQISVKYFKWAPGTTP